MRNNPERYTDSSGHNPVLALVLLVAATIVLMDYADDGEINTIIPDALVVSASVTDSTNYLLSYHDDKSNPFDIQIDAVVSPDQSSIFETSTYAANPGVCAPNAPCVTNPNLPNFISPTIGASGTIGLIWGEDIKDDIKNFEGKAYNINISIGVYSINAFSSAEKNGDVNFDVVGVTVGYGVSKFPITVGGFYTNTNYVTRIGTGNCGKGSYPLYCAQ